MASCLAHPPAVAPTTLARRCRRPADLRPARGSAPSSSPTGWATALLKLVNRAIARQSKLPGAAVLRPGRLPVGRAARGELEGDPGRARRGARAPRRAAELPGHLHRPGHPHRRRPVEDLLLLRLRVPQRRQLRAVPRDRPRSIERDPRDGDGDVLDPGARQAHPARTTARTRACSATTSDCVVPDAPSTSVGIRVGDETRGGPRARASCSTTRYEHEAWNDTDEIRVVLFLDVVRPLR